MSGQQQDHRGQQPEAGVTSSPALVAASWALVGVPLAYGLWQTLVKASQLFG